MDKYINKYEIDFQKSNEEFYARIWRAFGSAPVLSHTRTQHGRRSQEKRGGGVAGESERRGT